MKCCKTTKTHSVHLTQMSLYSTEKEYLLSEVHPRPLLQSWGWGEEVTVQAPVHPNTTCLYHSHLPIGLASWFQSSRNRRREKYHFYQKKFIMLSPDTPDICFGFHSCCNKTEWGLLRWVWEMRRTICGQNNKGTRLCSLMNTICSRK